MIHTSSGQGFYFSERVPRDTRRCLLRRKTQINLYELLAVLVAIHTFQESLAGKRVVVFVDNTAALNTAIRGWSPREDANGIVHQLWMVIARAGIDAQWVYVPSKLNLADGPSRGVTGDVERMGLVRCGADWPEDS